jgi:hypothetical protein
MYLKRKLLSRWKHKVLVLFKLLLLEKRTVFFGTPVRPVCTTILSIISLHPQLLNKGLGTGFEVIADEKKDDEKLSDDVKSEDVDSLLKPITLPSEFHRNTIIFNYKTVLSTVF